MWLTWLDAIARQTVPPPPAGADSALLAWALGLSVTALAVVGWRFVRRLEKLVDDLVPVVKELTEAVKADGQAATRERGEISKGLAEVAKRLEALEKALARRRP